MPRRVCGKDSSPHKALELTSREVDCLVYRFALLRALGDQFADGALCEHLRAEAGWRWITGKQGRHIAARWIIVQRSRWRLFVFPSPEVAQLLEGRNVNAVASGDKLFDRRTGRQKHQEAL